MKNKLIEKILDAHKMEITYFVRHVYLIQNQQGDLLFAHQVEPVGNVGELYLGWQLTSLTYWGVDFLDDDVDEIQLVVDTIQFQTQLQFSADKVTLVDFFYGKQNDHKILNVVYLLNCKNCDVIEPWGEWVLVEDALGRELFPEDRYIIEHIPTYHDLLE